MVQVHVELWRTWTLSRRYETHPCDGAVHSVVVHSVVVHALMLRRQDDCMNGGCVANLPARPCWVMDGDQSAAQHLKGRLKVMKSATSTVSD